jgi:hypothetical protein
MVEWRPDERRASRLEQSAFELRVLLPSASRHRSVSGHPASASDEAFEVQTREQPDSPRIIAVSIPTAAILLWLRTKRRRDA